MVVVHQNREWVSEKKVPSIKLGLIGKQLSRGDDLVVV